MSDFASSERNNWEKINLLFNGYWPVVFICHASLHLMTFPTIKNVDIEVDSDLDPCNVDMIYVNSQYQSRKGCHMDNVEKLLWVSGL